VALTFLAPQFLWALLALPLIVVLHFIRTRRRLRTVSALFLWRRAYEAAESRRRISPTWLLLLQLLFAALAALALARPSLSFQGPPDQVVVIDASASMAARDSDGVRLDKARELAERLIDRGGRTALVRAGLDAVVVAPLSSDRSALRRALADLAAGDRAADLARAVDLGRSLVPEGAVHVITDGPPPEGDFEYYSVGRDALNYGITTFDSGLGQAYVAVSSNDPRPQQIDVVLSRNGRELARTTLLVPVGGQAGTTFPVDDGDGFIEARLDVPGNDALALDDVAYAGQRRLAVSVSGDSAPVLRALQALPAVDVSRAAARGPAVDVHVLFGASEEEIPAGNVLVFAAPAEEPVYRSIRDWDQGDELLRFVDLREAVVGLAPDLPNEERPGWETLARAADLSPVISRRRDERGTVVRVAFHPSQTDLVLRPAFPAFMANAMNGFRGETTLPLGTAVEGVTDSEGRRVERLLAPGIYRGANSADVGAAAVSASLLSAGETRLPAGPPEEATSTSGEPGERVGSLRGIATWLLLAAAALLLLEWLAWTRGSNPWLRGG
jgi:Ca-activated chloride channel family protein